MKGIKKSDGTVMDGLIAFLRARLDEDERAARTAAEPYGKRWWWNTTWGLLKGDPDDSEAVSVFSVGEDTIAAVWSEVGPHMARHDPAFVVRDVEAKRRLLDEYERMERSAATSLGRAQLEGGLSGVIRLLAASYDLHSDYRPHWRP